MSGAAISDLTGPKCSPNTVHWTYDTWMLAQRHRQGAGENRWRHLVLPHVGLCVRSCARARHHRGRPGQRRQGVSAACCPSARTPRTSRRSCCRRRPRRQRSSGSPMPAATPSTAIKQGAEFGITAGGQHFAGLLVFISDVQCARPEGRAGAGSDRNLLLGHERRHPRLDQALAGRAAGQVPDHDAGRRLFGGHALPEGGCRAEERGRRQGRGRQDEGNADRRSAVRQGLRSAPTAAKSTPPICSR